MKKDLDYIQSVEKAIQDKYGEHVVKDPRSSWSEEKGKDYIKQKEESYTGKKSFKKEKIDEQLVKQSKEKRSKTTNPRSPNQISVR